MYLEKKRMIIDYAKDLYTVSGNARVPYGTCFRKNRQRILSDPLRLILLYNITL